METFIKIMDLIANDETIPVHVKLDVAKRISDWCSSNNGAETDEYVLRQYYYLMRIKESMK